MSKYKYSSLLSSQYRQVFKSYHSLDRCEEELKQNHYKSLHKQIHTQVGRLESKHKLCREKDSFPEQVMKRPESYLHYKEGQKYQSLDRSSIDQRMKEINRQNYVSKPTMLSQNYSIRYIDSTNIQPSFVPNRLQTSTSSCFGLLNPSSSITRPTTYQNKNPILKMKVSQINKRRNDIKLKVRANDTNKISKKYEYLKHEDEDEEIDGPRRENVTEIYQKQYIPNEAMMQSPLLSISNNIPKTSNISKIIGQKQHFSTNQPLHSAFKAMGEQNIQTPHFHQTDVSRQGLSPTLIEMKLQSLVKNTFTDRF